MPPRKRRPLIKHSPHPVFLKKQARFSMISKNPFFWAGLRRGCGFFRKVFRSGPSAIVFPMQLQWSQINGTSCTSACFEASEGGSPLRGFARARPRAHAKHAQNHSQGWRLGGGGGRKTQKMRYAARRSAGGGSLPPRKRRPLIKHSPHPVFLKKEALFQTISKNPFFFGGLAARLRILPKSLQELAQCYRFPNAIAVAPDQWHIVHQRMF